MKTIASVLDYALKKLHMIPCEFRGEHLGGNART